MEESKEKVRRVKKKYIDEIYPFKVKEVFFILLFNKSALELYKTHTNRSQECRKTRLCTEYAKKNAVDANSEFTQQDGRKKRTAKRLHVTNLTGSLLACFVVIFT